MRILGLPFLAIAAVSANPLGSDAADVVYTIAVEPTEDRTHLHVSMDFAGDEDGVTRIALPDCGYGTPRIWESVVGLTAGDAKLREVTGMPRLRDLVHAPSAPLQVGYTLSRTSAMDDGVAYRPSVSATHFHYFDAQWRCRLPERTGVRSFEVAFEDVPEKWTVFSSLGSGAGPYRVSSTDEDLSAFVAGGDYRAARFEVQGKSVSVYVGDDFEAPERVVEDLRAIAHFEAETFGPFAGQFYVVSLSARDSITAGVAIDNAFVCFLGAQSSRENVNVLLAHEYFHNWLPRTATITSWKHGESLDEFRFDWFLEGFTEYLARRMLLDAGFLSMEAFVERFNRDLAEQARNPMRQASLEVVAAALEAGEFTNRHERTTYFRGPLIALSWDNQLRRAGDHTLYDLVRSFLERGAAAGGTLDEDDFFALVEGFGIDGWGDYTKHIVEGEPPMPDPGAFGDGFVFEAGGNPSASSRFVPKR